MSKTHIDISKDIFLKASYDINDGVLINGLLSINVDLSLVIPDGVTSIGVSAFSKCLAIASLVIPDGVTSIGDRAFNGCYALTSLILPENLEIIGDYAFGGCRALTDIYYPGTQAKWEAIKGIDKAGFKGTETIHYNYIPS